MIKSKYGAEKINIDGYTFDSKVEGKYYEYLKGLKAKGEILNFELQPRFTLQPKYKNNGVNVRAIEYVADFQIYYNDLYSEIIDVKGLATPEAKMKRKMYNYQYPMPLKWVIWSKGYFRDYDTVIKERAANKKVKENKLC